MGDIQTHLFYLCWWMCTHKQSEEHTHTFAGRHFQPLTHSVLGPWLPSKWFVSRDPSYSAGLNKSHQAASDSSYVDVMLNVIWRLGEHRIGPCSASQGTLSLCDVIFSFVDSVHSLMLSLSLSVSCTHSHPQQTIKIHNVTHIAWYIIALYKAGAISSTPRTHPAACLFCSSCSISPPHTRDPSCHCSHCHASVPEELPALPDCDEHSHTNEKTQIIISYTCSCTQQPTDKHTHTNI